VITMTGSDNGERSTDDRRISDIDKAALIWDEYKYRHDLIWRHLIRSTVAVVALITVAYSSAFQFDKALIIVSGVLAVVFSAFNLWVVNAELDHYWRVRDKHSEYQETLFDFEPDNEYKTRQKLRGFGFRVNAYLLVLVLIALATTLFQVLPQYPGV